VYCCSKDRRSAKRKAEAIACEESGVDDMIIEELVKYYEENNVIRSGGGGKAARIETHKQRKIEQDEFISSTVDKIIQDYISEGKLKEGELDNGAVLLCKRRSAATVEAALAEYIEQRGDGQFDNLSAFFTTVMCMLVTEEGSGASDRKGRTRTWWRRTGTWWRRTRRRAR